MNRLVSNRILHWSFIAILALLVGTRSNGVFLWLFIFSFSLNVLAFLSDRRQALGYYFHIKPLLGLLSAYVFFLCASGFKDAGIHGLKESLALYLSIPFLFLAGFNLSILTNALSLVGVTSLLAFLGVSMSVSSLEYAFLNHEMTSSSLRPSELIFSFGLLLIVCTFKIFQYSFKILAAKSSVITRSTLVVLWSILAFLSLTGAFVFKGFSSSICLLFILLLFGSSLASRFRAFMLTILLAMALAVVGVFPSDAKFWLLKVFVNPIAGTNVLNGRIENYTSGLQVISPMSSTGGVKLIGSASNQIADIWAHNFLLDSLMHEGILPTVSIIAFAILYVIYCISSSALQLHQRFFVCFVSAIMFLVSMVQPVQYSDGSVFALSFLLLGILLSMSRGDASSVELATHDSVYSIK